MSAVAVAPSGEAADAARSSRGRHRRDPAARRGRARALGRALSLLLDDPEAMVVALRRALAELADDEYRAGLARVAPGLGSAFGVRTPLLRSLGAGFGPALRSARPAVALWASEHLSREPELEFRLLALPLLRRSLREDPERTWQLMRRLGRRAGDWISVDSLAGLVAEGILREPFRWAEIEQLVYAENPWERRLAGATLATMPSTARRLAARGATARPLGAAEVTRGLALVGSLLGDDDANVRRALSWALRSLAAVDRDAVAAFASAEAARARAEENGSRAWVIRDALPALDPAVARRVRTMLAGIRRRPRAGSTSRAAEVARGFGRLPDPRTLPEPPL